jgi:hypothetical protein
VFLFIDTIPNLDLQVAARAMSALNQARRTIPGIIYILHSLACKVYWAKVAYLSTGLSPKSLIPLFNTCRALSYSAIRALASSGSLPTILR